MRISVVIVTFNSDKIIKNCLDSVNEADEIIIVENSNRKEFKENFENYKKNLKIILTGSNIGYGRGNNIGIKESKNDYVLILNPDAVLAKNTINILKKTLFDKDFAIAAPEVNNNLSEINTLETLTDYNLINVEYVKGFAMLIKKSKFKNFFFDENIFLYLEEIDLCKRAKLENENIFLVKNCFVQHYGARSHNSEYNYEMELSRNWHWMWSKFYYEKKYYGNINAYLKTLPNFFSAFLKYLIYFIIFNKKRLIYKMRFLGLLNSYLGKKSFYRPKLNENI